MKIEIKENKKKKKETNCERIKKKYIETDVAPLIYLRKNCSTTNCFVIYL